jgi:hypothetical protein
MRILAFRLPHRGIRSATPTTFDFGAIFPFTFVSAYHLPVYASQWPLPDTTQDSVPGCWLGFTRAAISGCCIPCACKAQSSSNRTCRFTASGSRTRQHAFAHERSSAVHPTPHRAVLPRRTPTEHSAHNRQGHHLGGHWLPRLQSGFFLRFSMWHLPQRLHIAGVY